MDCDGAEYWEHCQIQAGVSIWQHRRSALDLLEQWVHFCSRREVVSDDPNVLGLPNFPEFVDHRHDQSVLTNLCLKFGISALGSPGSRVENAHNINSLVDYVEQRFLPQRLARARRMITAGTPRWARRHLRRAGSLTLAKLWPGHRHLLE